LGTAHTLREALVEKNKTFDMGNNNTCTNMYCKSLTTEHQQNY
jgi:hypothetical protein